MRQDFFTLKPAEKSQALATADLDTGVKSMYESDAEGKQHFRVRFDVSEFQPEEIQVSTVPLSLSLYHVACLTITTSNFYVINKNNKQLKVPINDTVHILKISCFLPGYP